MGFLLPNPSPWAGMRVIFGRGLFNKVCSGLPLQVGWGTNGLLPTPLRE